MKKVVLKVDLYDDRVKQKAMKTVSGISGVESVSVDMKDKKLTLMGDIDPVHVVGKRIHNGAPKIGTPIGDAQRKLCHTEIVSVGPANEEKKKGESNKLDDKKDSTKVPEHVKLYETYPLYYQTRPLQYNQYHCVTGVEEDPNNCVICLNFGIPETWI